MTSQSTSRFLVIEGIDGAGTTTQAALYAEHLRSRGRRVHVTREPSTGPLGAMIRQVLSGRLTMPNESQAAIMALLFAADRLDHVASEVNRYLEDGYVVLSDRYDLSSLAYQSISAPSGQNPDDLVAWIRSLNRYAKRPDATLVVNVSPEIAAARRRSRGGPEELFDHDGLQARLAAAYKRADTLVPGDRLIHIDGDGSVETVAATIQAALASIVEN
jgi:dTMP kinase